MMAKRVAVLIHVPQDASRAADVGLFQLVILCIGDLHDFVDRGKIRVDDLFRTRCVIGCEQEIQSHGAHGTDHAAVVVPGFTFVVGSLGMVMEVSIQPAAVEARQRLLRQVHPHVIAQRNRRRHVQINRIAAGSLHERQGEPVQDHLDLQRYRSPRLLVLRHIPQARVPFARRIHSPKHLWILSFPYPADPVLRLCGHVERILPGALGQFDLVQRGGGEFDRLVRSNLGDSHRTKMAQGNHERRQMYRGAPGVNNIIQPSVHGPMDGDLNRDRAVFHLRH